MSSVGHSIDGKFSISAVTIQLAEHARPFKSAGFAINKEERKVQWTRKGTRTLEATFEPPLRVFPSDQLEFHLRRSLLLGGTNLFDKVEVIPPIDASRFTNAPSSTEGNTREWRHLFRGNEIIFRLPLGVSTEDSSTPTARSIPALPSGPLEDPSPSQNGRLVPGTDEIARICPKFRILLIGKNGVGKSSLINQAFQVENALVSHSAPGIADIGEGIDHPRFILHDSQGFEPGEAKNFKTVQDFIKRRDNMPELKDKLHAIWICILTPATGTRIHETGVEEILRLKRSGDLGKVPVIVVFTKYDALVKREDRLFDDPQYKTEEEISKQIKKKALATLVTDCIVPLKKAVGDEILYAAVSTQEGYQDTLSDLIKLTFDNVKEHIAKEASIAIAMAQNVDFDLKFEALNADGRSKYWSGLMPSTPSTIRKLRECLEVIHRDIIVFWSLKDSDMILQNQTFMVWMSEMVDQISATVSGRKHMLMRLMAYIIDLTLIMQHIFCILQGIQYTISRRVVSIVYAAYDISSVKANVHKLIVEHVDKPITSLPGRATTFQKIVDIIENNVLRIDSAELSRLQSIIQAFEGEDRAWQKYQFYPSPSPAEIYETIVPYRSPVPF